MKTLALSSLLLLCLAACALWVRSYWHRDSWVVHVTTPTSAHHGAFCGDPPDRTTRRSTGARRGSTERRTKARGDGRDTQEPLG